MLENLTTTEILAALIGLYCLAMGVGFLAERDEISKMFDDISQQPALGFLAGIIAFIVGGAIVGVHNAWDDLLSSVVSLIGWLGLAEGVLLLAFRKSYLGAVAKMALSKNVVTGFAGVAIVGGLALLACALMT